MKTEHTIYRDCLRFVNSYNDNMDHNHCERTSQQTRSHYFVMFSFRLLVHAYCKRMSDLAETEELREDPSGVVARLGVLQRPSVSRAAHQLLLDTPGSKRGSKMSHL
jgi:hypothetical protein